MQLAFKYKIPVIFFTVFFFIKVSHSHVLVTVYFDKRNKSLGRENNRPHGKSLVLVFSKCDSSSMVTAVQIYWMHYF